MLVQTPIRIFRVDSHMIRLAIRLPSLLNEIGLGATQALQKQANIIFESVQDLRKANAKTNLRKTTHANASTFTANDKTSKRRHTFLHGHLDYGSSYSA